MQWMLPATGSAAGSAWSNNYSVNDPNEGLLDTRFAVPNRVGANLSGLVGMVCLQQRSVCIITVLEVVMPDLWQ